MTLVKIIAITQPLVREETKGGELQQLSISEFVAYCARVSNPLNQFNNLTASKLLKYLAKHKHWSPFEMVNIVMEIETTRDIARQMLRHKSFSFQEFSQRYADPTKDLGFVIRETRLQDTKNRQNSIITDNEKLQHEWEEFQTNVKNQAINAYTWAISNGIAKEQARSVLPEGLTISRMYMNGTLRSWIHYCLLRMANGTQKEHQIIAKKCWDNILVYFPDLDNIILE